MYLDPDEKWKPIRAFGLLFSSVLNWKLEIIVLAFYKSLILMADRNFVRPRI